MIYLDTNIFLHPILANDVKLEGGMRVIKKVINGELAAGTSPLTWDEFNYTIRRRWGIERATQLSQDLLSTPNLVFLDTTEEIVNKAQELTLGAQLDPRDAIHAATAIINGCTEIVSDDNDFDRVKELKRKKV